MSPFLKQFSQSSNYIPHNTKVVQESLWLRVGTLAGAAFMMVLYVAQINSISVKGFQIHEMEERVNVMQQENQRMQLTIATLQSSEEMKLKIQELGLTSDGVVEYISLQGATVALNH